MDQQRFDILMAKALSDTLNDNERDEFERMKSEFPELKDRYDNELRVWEGSCTVKLFHRIESFKACDLDKVRARIRSNHKPSVVPIRRLAFTRMAAASVILLLAVSSFLMYNYVPGFGKWDAVTAKNSIEIVQLPDHSTVSLNKNSRIVYLHRANSDKRVVRLSGEAFFDVQKNPQKPFVVKTGDTEVRVLGTSFNVKSKGQTVEVAVSSGKVNFGNGHDGITLIANEKGIYRKGKFSKESLIGYNHIAWKTGEVVFSNNTLQEVAKMLNDSFDEIKDVQIKTNDAQTRITTKFKTKSLPDIFDELSVHFNKKFTLHEGTLVISD